MLNWGFMTKKGAISLRTIAAQGADCPTGRTDSCTDGQSNLLRPFRAKKCCDRRYICRYSHKKNKMASETKKIPLFSGIRTEKVRKRAWLPTLSFYIATVVINKDFDDQIKKLAIPKQHSGIDSGKKRNLLCFRVSSSLGPYVQTLL